MSSPTPVIEATTLSRDATIWPFQTGGTSAVSSVTGGSGISVSPTTGATIVTNTGVTSIVAGPNIGIDQPTGVVTISAAGGGGGGGSVTSIDASGGVTGMTFTGGPITVSGTLTLGGTLAMANGGFGASVQAGRGYPLFKGGSFAFDGQEFNVLAYGAVGNNVTADTAGIDAAVAACKAAGGGTIYFPTVGKNGYKYSGTGISNDPGSTTYIPMFLRGDVGSSATFINFVAVSNADAIYLSSQATLGGTLNRGSGVSNLNLILPASKNGIHLHNLEDAVVSDVHISQGGTTHLIIEDSIFVRVKDCEFQNWATTGVSILGDTHVNLVMTNVNSTAAGTGWAFDYVRTNTTDTGAVVMVNCNSNYAGQGAYRFESPSLANTFIFLTDCVADGTYGATPFLFKNQAFGKLVGCWSSTGSAALPAATFDGCSDFTVTGGNFIGQGAGGSDISLLHSNNRMQFVGVTTSGGGTAITSDGTTHTNMFFDIAGPGGGTICNDYSKLSSVSTGAILATARPLFSALLSNSSAIASTNVETTFSKSYTIAAAQINRAGTSVRIRVNGSYSTTGAPSMTIRVKVGSATIASYILATATGASTLGWAAEASFTVRTVGSSAVIHGGYGIAGMNGGNTNASATVGTSTIDLTASQAITVTAQWGTASASNTITLSTMDVDIAVPASTVA